MKVLLVEDEKELLNAMTDYLSDSGFRCEKASNLKEAREKIDLYSYDCLVLDIGLPDGSGLKIIEEMKKKNHQTGLVIVSARNSLDDRLAGLNMGADDYIVKPFHMPELVARLNSVFRRRTLQGQKEIVFNELRVVPEEMLFYVAEKSVSLTKSEHDLLMFLLSNPNKVLTREAIAEHLWGDYADMADTYDFIYSHVKNLRKKIIDNGGKDYLKSVYGVGYKFSA
jgi:DNA-binding response OmpR family regulator